MAVKANTKNFFGYTGFNLWEGIVDLDDFSIDGIVFLFEVPSFGIEVVFVIKI